MRPIGDNCAQADLPTVQPEASEILNAALQLPEDQRLILASRLLETVPNEPAGLSLDDPDLAEKLKQRSSDRQSAIPWDQVRDEI